jgi:hypothetical protein
MNRPSAITLSVQGSAAPRLIIQAWDPKKEIGGGATGTIRPSTSPRMPTTGFEVRGSIVRQRSPRFASIHFEVDRQDQQFADVRQRSA